MCGIAGLLLDEMNPAGPDWLAVMTQQLHHRGPDDGGAVAFGMNGGPAVSMKLGGPDDRPDWKYLPMKLGLGSRRLAILDLSDAGHQPMSSPDSRVWLVYNGELYNHAALREELTARGMPFTGHSDTEVFLAAYRSWGVACFERFDGMWGAAIVDWTAGRLVLSRDRCGIKPLYLTRFSHGMAFASEIKSLLHLPGALKGVNEARLRDFLCDGSVDHTDQTLFEGIEALPAGCFLEVDLKAKGAMHAGGAVRRFWSPPMQWTASGDSSSKVRAALTRSIQSHLQGDVPIGTCLSGGVDSSSIVCLLAELRRSGALGATGLTQHTFTASMAGTDVDESHHAAMVVAAAGELESHVVHPSADGLVSALPLMLWHQEQPFGLPNMYLQWEVMRAARDAGIKVLLDGQGGDELFCGYEGFLPAYLAHLIRRGAIARLLREWRFGKSMHFANRGLLLHVMAALAPERWRNEQRLRRHARRQPWLARDLFSAEESKGVYLDLEIDSEPARFNSSGASAMARRVHEVFAHQSLPSLLRFEDRNSMAFSIEARVPFLSREMVELALAIPVEEKIERGVLKQVLRRAMRGVTPDAILDRRDKVGFGTPIVAWMHGGLSAWWRDLLGSKSFTDRGCFAPKAIPALIKRLEAGDGEAARAIWRVALVEQWARMYLDS